MKNRHIGVVIFTTCAGWFLKIQLHMAVGGEHVDQLRKRDFFGAIDGLQYYIAVIGLFGLGIVAQDVIEERFLKNREKRGVLPRSKMQFLEWSDGTILESPNDESLRTAAKKLFAARNSLSCRFSVGNGWTIAASATGDLTLVNVYSGAGPWGLTNQTEESLVTFWLLLKSGCIPKIRDASWVRIV
jgi:hypothetical protein